MCSKATLIDQALAGHLCIQSASVLFRLFLAPRRRGVFRVASALAAAAKSDEIITELRCVAGGHGPTCVPDVPPRTTFERRKPRALSC